LHKIDVAKFLQKHGVIKKKQTPDKAIKTVDKLLKEIFYAGYIEYLPWGVTRRLGHHEAIISIDVYNTNQKRLNAKETTYSRVDLREDFELRGLVNCICCGKKYTGAPSTSKTGKKHNYYKCNNKGCQLYGKSIPAKALHEDFVKLIKGIKAKDNTIDLALRIFEDVWQTELSEKAIEKEEMQKQKNEIEGNISKFALEAIKTQNPVVKQEYEKQIESLSKELEPIDNYLSAKIDYKIPCRTSQKQVVEALKNPYSVWEKYQVIQKHRFYNFMFEGNLTYDKNSGFRTPNLSLPLRIFSTYESSEPTQVEMAGIEPASKKLTDR